MKYVMINVNTQHGGDLRELYAFLDRYNRFTAEKATLRFQTFQISFTHIKAALGSIKTLAQGVDKQHAPQFNLFHLLGVAKAEVTTHTALLANLLNPAGSHGQGTLFLETFWRHW